MQRLEHTGSEKIPRAASDRVLRVGIDLGIRSTVFQSARGLGDLLVPRTHALPSVIACDFDEDGNPRDMLIGEEALAYRDELPLLNPLLCDNVSARNGFADHIRRQLGADGADEIWGVVGMPPGASARETERLRLVANRILDRTKFLDGAVLMATSYGSYDVARNSLWVDVGARSVRIAPVHGGASVAEEAIVIDGGTDAVCQRLRDALGARFPDLPVTSITAHRLVERFGFVAPARPRCLLRLRLDGAERAIDLAPIVQRACEPLVNGILAGLRRALRACPSDAIEEFLSNVVLSGGGSRLQGLRRRIQDESRREFAEVAKVSVPETVETLVANGALRWAFLLQEEEWEIPLVVGC